MFEAKLVDSLTGEVIAYKYVKDMYSCVVSLEKAKELKLEDSDILEFLSLDEIIVRTYQGKYYMEEFCVSEFDLPDGLVEENTPLISIGGMQFKTQTGCNIDIEYAINRCLTGVEL